MKLYHVQKKTFIISGAFKTCNIYTSGSVIMFELQDFSHAYIVPHENFKGVNKKKDWMLKQIYS